MPLTNVACLNAKPRPKPYKLADGGGLYLEVTPTGGKYWRLKYRFAGKEKRLALGVYPAVPIVLARERREAARKHLDEGLDPGAMKRERKAKAVLEAATTFELIAREWHEQQRCGWTAGHANDVMHLLEVDLLPRLGTLPVNNITAPDVLACLRKIEDRNAGHIALRGRQVCGQVFRYAIVTGRAGRNPAADLQGALRPLRRGHFAALGHEDLPELLAALGCNDANLHAHTLSAIRLLMLTFVRTSELIAARWNKVEFDTAKWCIPAERMKMRRPHIVPLARQSLSILEDQRRLTGHWDWIFPNRNSPREHMSNGAILMALNRMGFSGRMTGHGFRALATSTIKEELGYRHEVVDRQLAHAPRNKVDAAYDRATFLSERKKMMQDWGDYLERVGRGNTLGRAKPSSHYARAL